MIEKQMKDLAWNTFKQTGNIDTFMELIQVQKLEENRIRNQFNNDFGDGFKNHQK